MDIRSDHSPCDGNNSSRIISSDGKKPLRRQFAIRDEASGLDRTKRSHNEGYDQQINHVEVEDQTASSSLSDKILISSVDSDGRRSWLKYFTNRSSTDCGNTLGINRKPQRVVAKRIRKTHFDNESLRKDHLQRDNNVNQFPSFNRSVSVPDSAFIEGQRKRRSRFRRAMSNKELSSECRTHEYRIIEQTKDFCRDIIIQTLKRNNMFNRVKLGRAPTRDKSLSNEIQTICSELERRNPNLCKNISRQIGITLRSEEVLRKIFFELATEIILSDKEVTSAGERIERKVRTNSLTTSRDEEQPKEKDLHITWGRILGIFVSSGAFAIDCIKQGHSELVSELIEFNGDFFVEEGVIDWISSQGGWKKLSEVNSLKVKEVDPANIWNILLMSACIFAVLAFGVGIKNFTVVGM